MLNIKSILLVDDDEDDQLLFRDAVAEARAAVDCMVANNGKEALNVLQKPPPPDVIFLDLNMPVMNGIECLNALKSHDTYKNIPVVIFSTSNSPADIERTKEMGASLFFHKPSSFNALREKLGALLSSSLADQRNFYMA